MEIFIPVFSMMYTPVLGERTWYLSQTKSDKQGTSNLFCFTCFTNGAGSGK